MSRFLFLCLFCLLFFSCVSRPTAGEPGQGAGLAEKGEEDGEGTPDPGSPDLVVPVSDEELMEAVRVALSGLGKPVSSINKVFLPEFGTIYWGSPEPGGRTVFARLVARRIPCMDCHNVFFLYSFDDRGNFLEFIPIHITKRNNLKWDREDVGKIKKPFEGQSLLKETPFNPLADAVTTATISSKIVFHSLNQTRAVYDALVDLGYISPGTND